MRCYTNILVALLLACTLPATAQVFVPGQEGFCIDGKATLFVAAGATLHVDGNFYNKRSQLPWAYSNGVMSLTGNLTCNDPLICVRASSLSATSKFIFSPKSPTVTISSSGDSLVFYHTILNRANTVVKLSPGLQINILDTFDLQAGSLLLNGGTVHFSFPVGTVSYINHPYLKNENHKNRIFGDSGYVKISTNIPNSFSSVSAINLANLGLVLKGASVPNSQITIKRGHAKQVYAGNGSITRYFDVSTNQALVNNDSIFIHYIDSAERIGLGINKHKLKLFVSPSGDMDYSPIPSFNLLNPKHLAKGTASTFTSLGINSSQFRITVADEACSNPPISALPNGTLNLCPGITQTIDAGNNTSIPNTNLLWHWNTGATSQTIAVTSTSLTQHISVELKDVRGCITRDTLIIAPTAPNPSANFTPYSKCFGDTVKLLSSSTIASGAIASFYWQFGDGTHSALQVNDTVKKRYAAAGLYSVTLLVTSNYGCTSSITKPVYAFPLPTAAFTHSFDCASGLMAFVNTSSVNPMSGAITQCLWNFDLNNTNAYTALNPSVSPTHSYSAGSYTVKLLAKTGVGCKDNTIQTVLVQPKNLSSFSVTNACLGDTLDFINNSVCLTGGCNYSWDFGDGTQSIAPNPKKIFQSTGVYNVTLRVYSSSACTDSSTAATIVHPKASVDFVANPVCFGEPSILTNNSSIQTGSISAYLWDFGNSTNSTNTNASLTYSQSGNYNVSLTATSNFGCVSKIIKTLSVYDKPIAQYNVSPVCFGQSSIFSNNSVGTLLSYAWDFGNTVTSTNNQPSYVYPTPGTYTSSLFVTDVNGCKDTSVVLSTVYANPNISLGGTITTCGTSYTLSAGLLNLTYLWQPLNVTTPSVAVYANGIYSVTATDAQGCVGTDQVLVSLNSVVKPHLGNDTTACGSILLNAGYPGSTYVWANTAAPTQTLLATTASTYIVTVTDLNNCSGSDTIVVQINTPPTLSLGADITQCKTNQPVTITPTTNASTFLWSNGQNQANLVTNTSGNYALTVTGSNGCKAYDTLALILLPSPLVNLGSDANVCAVKLLDAQNAGYNHLWSTGNVSQTVQAVSSGIYWVDVANPNNGCTTRDSISLVVSPPVNVSLGNDTSTCSNTTFVLDAGNNGATYQWSTGANTPTITIGNSGAYGVTVNNGACSAFDVIQITVLSSPVVNLGNNLHYLCGNGSVILTAGNNASVSWGSDVGYSSNQPSIAVTQAGTYWAQVFNGSCYASDTVQVIQSTQNLLAYFIASTIDTVGVPVKFVDVSEPTPSSWYWDFGDGFYSTEQSPEHIFLVPQTFSVSLTVSNGFCSSQITKSVNIQRSKHFDLPSHNNTIALLNLMIYPNPASNYVKTLLETNDLADITFALYEMTGKLVYSQTLHKSRIFDEEIPLGDLTNGLYMIDIVAESNKGFVKRSSKLIIMK